MCSDLCLLKPGGYQCTCPTGIVLKEDGKNCDYGEVTYSTFQPLRRRGGGICYHWSCMSRTHLNSREEEEISFPKFRKKVKMRAARCRLWSVCTLYYGFPTSRFWISWVNFIHKLRYEARLIVRNIFLAFIYLLAVFVVVVSFLPSSFVPKDKRRTFFALRRSESWWNLQGSFSSGEHTLLSASNQHKYLQARGCWLRPSWG